MTASAALFASATLVHAIDATAVLTGTASLIATAAIASAAVAGPAASTATAPGIADSGAGRDVISIVADRVPALACTAVERAHYEFIGAPLMVVGGRHAICDSKMVDYIGLLTKNEDSIDKSTAQGTMVLLWYYELLMELVCFYRVCGFQIDPGLIVGLSEKFGCAPDCQYPSRRTNIHHCLSIQGNPRLMDLYRRCEHIENQLITCSCGILPGRLVYPTAANLVHLITKWNRCERIGLSHPCIRLFLFLRPVAALVQKRGQGAEDPDSLSSVALRIAIGAESTNTTMRVRCNRYLTAIAGTIHPEAATMTEYLRSRLREMLMLESPLLLGAIGPCKGEEEDRPPGYTRVAWVVPPHRHVTQRDFTDDLKPLREMTMIYKSSRDAVVASYTWWLDEWLVCIKDVDEPHDIGEIAETIASEAETISAEEGARAGELDILESPMGIDGYVIWKYKRPSCGLYVEVTIWSRHDLFGTTLIRTTCMSDGCADPTRSTLMPRRRNVTMPQYRFCFTSITPLDGHLTRFAGEDAVQPALPMNTVIGLEVEAHAFLHEIPGLQWEQAEDGVAEGVVNDDTKFYTIDRKSSHPRKRTSSGNLWQQIQGRMTKSAVVQSIAETVEESKHEEQVAHMACYITLDGMSKEFDDLVLLCNLGSLTQRGLVVIPFRERDTSAVYTATTRRTLAACSSPTSLPMFHYHCQALGKLLGSVVSGPKLASELAAPALRTRVVDRLMKTILVSMLRRCRIMHLIAESASSHGLFEMSTQIEVDRTELNAGGFVRSLRRSTFGHIPLGDAGLPTDAHIILLRDIIEPGERTKDNDIGRCIRCIIVRCVHDMDNKGTLQGDVDPSLWCRRKPVTARALWTDPGDALRNLPGDDTADGAWWPCATEILGISELSVYLYIESRVVCELDFEPPLALVKGYMGSARWTSLMLMYSGNNRCGLYGTLGFFADAFDVHVQFRTWYRWQDLEEIGELILVPRRLPGTRSFCSHCTCCLTSVGGPEVEEFHFAAPLLGDSTKEHGNSASLIDEAPCWTMVQYYETEFGNLDNTSTVVLVPRGRIQCSHDAQGSPMCRCQSWTCKTSELCQAICTTIVSAETVKQDNFNRAWANVRVPILHQYTATCGWSITWRAMYDEKLFAYIIASCILLPDGRRNIDPAFKG